MGIEISVSNEFLSMFFHSINVFNCRLPGLINVHAYSKNDDTLLQEPFPSELAQVIIMMPEFLEHFTIKFSPHRLISAYWVSLKKTCQFLCDFITIYN